MRHRLDAMLGDIAEAERAAPAGEPGALIGLAELRGRVGGAITVLAHMPAALRWLASKGIAKLEADVEAMLDDYRRIVRRRS